MSAIFSECGKYRYRLTRILGDGPALLYVMFNPSTANADADDPTIESCTRIAKHNGFGSFEVVNLFAFKATRPEDLFAAMEPIGPKNDLHIWEAVADADRVVAAWGTLADKRPWTRARAETVLATLSAAVDVYALKVSKHGHPEHPLFKKGTLKPTLFRMRRAA